MGWLGNLIKGGIKLIPGVGNVAGAVMDGVDAVKGGGGSSSSGGKTDIGKILAGLGIGAAGINDLISGHKASSKRNNQLDAMQQIAMQNAQAGQDLYTAGTPIRTAAASAILARIRAGAGAPVDVSGLASRRNPMRANYQTPAMRAPLGQPSASSYNLDAGAPAAAPGTPPGGTGLGAILSSPAAATLLGQRPKVPRTPLQTAAASLMARQPPQPPSFGGVLARR